jgi:hypothetical protein
VADPAPAPAPARGASGRPILLLVIVAPLLFVLLWLLRAGGGLTPGTSFDWSPYPPEVRVAVDRAARNLDCAGLARQRAWATSAAASGTDTGPLIQHIDGIRRQIVCPP